MISAPGQWLAFSQGQEKKPDEPKKPVEEKVLSDKELEKENHKKAKAQEKVPQLSKAEAIAEGVIWTYGSRPQLEKVRGAIQEEGSIRLTSNQGDITGQYLLRQMRGEKSWKDLLRIDLELAAPGATQQAANSAIKYVIAFNGATVWSAQGNQYVTPQPDAEAAFRAQLTHDYTALLRYKEDGSKLELRDLETVVGVEANVLDLTTPDGEKTRFWVSTKTFRILHAEYELKMAADKPPTKFRISYFYTPYKVVQNTLVPVRRQMLQDGKLVQEITINAWTYSAKLDPQVFQHLQQ